MTRLLCLSVITLALGVHADAEGNKWKWARRAAGIAACAASAYDGYLSVAYLDGHHNLREANPLLANTGGTIRAGRMVGLKIGFCAAPIAMGEMRWHHKDAWRSATVVSAASAGLFTFVDVHNVRLIGRSR